MWLSGVVYRNENYVLYYINIKYMINNNTILFLFNIQFIYDFRE